jgi:hypothetical protein
VRVGGIIMKGSVNSRIQPTLFPVLFLSFLKK